MDDLFDILIESGGMKQWKEQNIMPTEIVLVERILHYYYVITSLCSYVHI